MKRLFPIAALSALTSLTLWSQKPVAPAPPPQLRAVLDRVLASEHAFEKNIGTYQPRIETYIQEIRPDPDTVTAPDHDHYFFGRLDTSRGLEESQFVNADGKVTGPSSFPLARFFNLQYNPDGFVYMMTPDPKKFDLDHYSFTYQGRQFLGDVRCLMFDVTPRKGGTGHFIGRIWVEDQNDNIVRFDGTFTPQPKLDRYFHFDSWRAHMGDHWLPTSIYIEQGDVTTAFSRVSLKGETRFWGYDLKPAGDVSELTDVEVESPAPVADESDTSHDASPLEQQRHWEAKAETDVLDRMTRAGLLAPPGEVDKVLETVVNNLEVTNNLVIDPDVHCRVLLTTPLESFTVGHTIVVSRGLIDVLPDEASVAMGLAHELGHIALNHKLDSMYAFDDRMMFTDEASFEKLRLSRSPAEEAAADAKGIELLRNSPYKDNLSQADLFLEAVSRQAHALPNLLAPHLGNPMTIGGRVARMQALLASAPQLNVRDLTQQAALPLAGRVRLDPWTDQLALSHARAVAMLSPQDKLTFEITPYEPYLTLTSAIADAAANSGD